ncbi:MAG: ABC transporter ATP-binding protein [Planctomycetota bacterium]
MENEERRVDNLRTLRRLIGRFRPLRARATVVFLLLLVGTALDIASPLLIGLIIDALTEFEGVLPERFFMLLWLLAGALAGRAALRYVTQVAAAGVGQDLENSLRMDLFTHVTRLRFAYHDENRSGATIARSLRDMEKTKHFFREVWFGYLEISLIVVAVLIMAFVVHWNYGLVVTGLFSIAITGTAYVGVRFASMDRKVSDHYDTVTNVLQENVAGARVVRAFGREPAEQSKFGGQMDTFSGAWSRLERFWTGVLPWINHLYHLAKPVVIVVGVVRIANGDGSIGEVATVLFYLRTVHHRIRPLTRMVIVGQQATASAARVFEVMDRDDVIEPPATPRQLPAARGQLRFEDVRFAHNGGPEVLKGISLHVPEGGSLGILGVTGAGKSTLVALVPRFYDPTAGRVLLDGIDVRDLAVPDLRRAVGLVFQEPFLFSASVADNIAYGNPDVGRERIEECARLAAAHEFIATLPEGYETVIGERGVSLSGGQRQRLTIARALAMDPRLLIFDDATASVDAVTEKELFTGIRAAAEGRTTLVISQRVTSVAWCDRVAVLEDGALTALGTHAELMESSALYQEIQAHQQLKEVVS